MRQELGGGAGPHVSPSRPMIACAGVLLATLVLAAGCETTIHRGLDEAQANEVLLALDAAAVGARKVEETNAGAVRYRIAVPSAHAATALRALAERDLPAPRRPDRAELYPEPGLVATPHEERMRFAAVRGEELAATLEGLVAVSDARVHLDLPDPAEQPLDAPPALPRASVLLRHDPDTEIDVSLVQRLVAAAVAGLEPAQVTVVTAPVAPPNPYAAMSSLGPFQVARTSAPMLRLVIAGSLAVNIVLAAAVLALVYRARRNTHTQR